MKRTVIARANSLASKSSSYVLALVIALGTLAGAGISESGATISTGTVLVTVKKCSQDLTGMVDRDQIRSLCNGSLQGSSVGLSFPEGGTQYYQLTDQSTGEFQFTITGPYVLIAPQVTGFPNVVGACSTGNDFGGGRTELELKFSTEYPFDVNDSGTRVRCEMWLYATPNDPGPPAKQQTLYLQALGCLSDLSNTVDPSAMAADCVSQLSEISVSVADENGNSLTNNTDSNGMTRFNVPTGALSLSVAFPSQFSGGWKVCNQFDEKSNPVSGPEIHPLTNGAGAPVTISSAGNISKCLVYLYHGPKLEPGISGRIFLCDTDLSALTLEQFQSLSPAAVCAQVGASMRVLVQDVVTPQTNEMLTGGDGTFFFPTGSNGSFQVVPVPSSSIYTDLAGVCTFFTAEQAVATADMQKGPVASGVPVNIMESSPLARCNFFIFDPGQAKPGENPQPVDTTKAQIQITARVCPDGFVSSSFDQLDATCTDAADPVSFTISGPTTETGSTSDGSVDFVDLPPGIWTITEETPEGFGQAVVICAKNDSAGGIGDNVTMPVVSGKSVTTDVLAGINMRCSWFNTTDPVIDGTIDGTGNGSSGSGSSSDTDTATLIIVLKTCPKNYNPDTVDADPLKECTELTDNVNISATSKDNKKKRRQTGEVEPGTSIYEGLKSGIYRLHQGYPKGVHKAFVLECESDTREFNYPYIPFARIDETGSIKIDIQAPETLTCSWFNIPSSTVNESPGEGATVAVQGNPEPETGTITVTVRACNGIPNASACDPTGEGFGISLVRADGNDGPIDFETNDAGIATIEVPSGSYSIDADVPLCFMDSPAVNAEGGIEVSAGRPTAVELFVCT